MAASHTRPNTLRRCALVVLSPLLVWVAIGFSSPAMGGEAVCPAAVDSAKRGAAYHFCGWPFVSGEADLRAMQQGLAWTYNWSSRPLTCAAGDGVDQTIGKTSVEFVPMVWGLVDDGAACAAEGPCFRVDERNGGVRCRKVCEANDWSFNPNGACYACYHEPVSRGAFVADVPTGSKHLLGFNEPNFKEQANLSPESAARGWRHVQWVADQRGLGLVGPATNFCDPTPGVMHAGACIEAIDGRTMLGLAWLETFYDACTAKGAAGFDCRIDHQAVHAYGCTEVTSMIDRMKRKAGLSPPIDAHCTNGIHDEDEFGVDCGGNACVACSEHARAQFGKPVWLTEFAAESTGCGEEDTAAVKARTERFLREQLTKLEQDPYVYRYAWFMPKTDMPALDHVDLLVQEEAGMLSPLGKVYFGEACRAQPRGTGRRRR